MLRIADISLPLSYTEKQLRLAVARLLRIKEENIQSLTLHKRSVDARKKDSVHFICTADVTLSVQETAILAKCGKKKVTAVQPYRYDQPKSPKLHTRPVVVGCGPAGLFAALILAQAGQQPILIERGKDVDSRTADVHTFWTSGKLDTRSNVQFGEGGAGTFSDGKLNTGTKDARARKVLEEFVQCGAPPEILYDAKPHIGTDKLRGTVKKLRERILAMGGEVHFETELTGFSVKENRITGVEVQPASGTKYTIETGYVLLAIGHSARDTFEMLHQSGVAMTQKAFSVGARIEHPQSLIDRSQYGKSAGHPALGAADYKLAVHLTSGRGVYTFCMCPGGSVVAAASEAGRLVTNGMSEWAREGNNANSALLVGITPEDFHSSHPLAGVAFQRELEEKAFVLGGSNYHAPVQRVEDFIKNRVSTRLGEVLPSYRPGYTLCNLSGCLPETICDAMRAGITEMDKRLHGFAHPDAILTGVETRSSSPVRILREDTYQSVSFSGLYPCGEGAGYAGGIISAAVDGIRCAEAILASGNT